MTQDRTTISTFSAEDIESHIVELGELIHACVLAGASINFILPFSQEDGVTFWRKKVLPAARDGGLVVLCAMVDGRIAGSVQLDHDTVPNQHHRAEIRKLMVHPDFRRRGIARLLMQEIEQRAVALGRTLITLDTKTGDKAEPLYLSLGYQIAGVIPGYARDALEDTLDGATFMYKPV